MGRYCQIVVGPAGCGKSTYCSTMIKHLHSLKRSAYVINLDPAAEEFYYDALIDIRNLIKLQDVMEELQLGPNGGLMYCMEHLLRNLDWLEEEIDSEWQDEYLLIDCPGQIELFTHSDIMKRLIAALEQRMHMRVCVVYLLESQFITDITKYFSGVLTAMSAMIQLEVPHVNILTKMDLIEGRPGEMMTALGRSRVVVDEEEQCSRRPMPPVTEADPEAPKSGYVNTWTDEEEEERDRRRDALQLDRFLDPDPTLLLDRANISVGRGNWMRLNEALVQLIEDFNMVAFRPLNIHDQDSIECTLTSIDMTLQYGEDEEPKPPKFDEEERDLEDEEIEEGDGGQDYLEKMFQYQMQQIDEQETDEMSYLNR